MFKNKKILIILVLALIILGVMALVTFLSGKNLGGKAIRNSLSASPAPEFMTNAEKEKLGIPAEQKIQAFRDEIGEVTVYKIIRDESDIVLDRTKIGPINPGQPAQ